jgi:hypothetical protein
MEFSSFDLHFKVAPEKEVEHSSPPFLTREEMPLTIAMLSDNFAPAAQTLSALSESAFTVMSTGGFPTAGLFLAVLFYMRRGVDLHSLGDS